MKSTIPLLLAATAILGTSYATHVGAQGERVVEITVIEDALESAKVTLYLDSTGTGTAVARQCEQCVPKRLKVSPTMQVYTEGQAVSWDASLDLSGRRADVFFNIESSQITRLNVQ